MATHTASNDDRDFRAAFETGKVSPEAFSDEAHLRLAYVYVVEHGPEVAQERMREALLSFLAAHQIPTAKFHETLTGAWVLAVSHFMDRSTSSSYAEFITQSQALLDSKVLLTHYSAGTLFSPEARASYVEPDLEAIPRKSGGPPKSVV